MDGPKPDKLDNLLYEAFREEARKIVPPSSLLLWNNLQQQMENIELRKMRDKQAIISETDETLRKNKQRAAIWKKRSYLAGLVAACLLLVVVYANTPENAGLRGFVSGFLPSIADKGQALTLGMRSAEQPGELSPSEATETPERGEKEADQSFNQNRSFSIVASETAPEAEKYTIASEDTEAAEKERSLLSSDRPPASNAELYQQNNMRESPECDIIVEIAGIQPEEGFEELYWQEENIFLNELKAFRDQTDSEISFLPNPPAGYSFQAGIVTKNNSIVTKISQEFGNENGLTFCLNQLFVEEEAAVEDNIAIAKENGSSYTYRSIKGYITRSPEGITNLTWKDGNRILILSGQLEDKLLKECLDLLEIF